MSESAKARRNEERAQRKNTPGGYMIRPSFGIRKRSCKFCEDRDKKIDYKDTTTLKRYTTDLGKIVGRKKSGLCAKHQREVARAIKRARHMALMPFTVKVKY